MRLTYFADRPIAIDGLQKRLSVAFECGGAWGVFDSPALLHRSLLWQRAEAVETLRQIDFVVRERRPPSWSWTGLDGEISYLNAPLGNVEWNPELRLDGAELHGMVQDFISPSDSHNMLGLIFDRPDNEIIGSPLRCFVVGKIKGARQEDRTYMLVLLVVLAGQQVVNRQLYRRVGVGILDSKYIDQDREKVSIC